MIGVLLDSTQVGGGLFLLLPILCYVFGLLFANWNITVGCMCSVRLNGLNFHLQMNLIRCRNVKYTTEPHITYTPCYGLVKKMFYL